MRDDESLVEAAVKMLVLFFILYLLTTTWYFYILQYRNGSSSSNTPDDMSLAGLAQLSFNDTSTNLQLRDPGFWSTALAESGRTTAYMLHDTNLRPPEVISS